jgi:hypothetical protein
MYGSRNEISNIIQSILKDCISNDELRKELETDAVDSKVKEYTARWLEYLKTTDGTKIVKQTSHYTRTRIETRDTEGTARLMFTFMSVS